MAVIKLVSKGQHQSKSHASKSFTTLSSADDSPQDQFVSTAGQRRSAERFRVLRVRPPRDLRSRRH